VYVSAFDYSLYYSWNNDFYSFLLISDLYDLYSFLEDICYAFTYLEMFF
jgi:hypothetical protein